MSLGIISPMFIFQANMTPWRNPFCWHHLLHYEMDGSSLFRSIRCGKKHLRIVFVLLYLLVYGAIQIQK